MEHDKLRPCPHCGGIASLKSNYSPQRQTYFVYAECTICGARGKTYRATTDPTTDTDSEKSSCDNAIAAWNMRTQEAQV